MDVVWRLAQVLLVADLFHPVDIASVDGVLDGDVGDGVRFGGTVPVLNTGRGPDHVAWVHLLSLAAPLLDPSGARGHDQGLTSRVGMPCAAGARAERDPA